MKKGKFITFEGGEGAGKSTQADMLLNYLTQKDQPGVLAHEPGGFEEAEAIRSILKGAEYNLSDLAELYLFSAARTMFMDRIVNPHIENGVHVISDRFADSTRAYQGYAGGVDKKLIERCIKDSTRGIQPDLTLIIDVDPTSGLEKETEAGRFSDKSLDYHTKVRMGFLDIAKKNPKRCVVIPYQEGKIHQTHQIIRETVSDRLGL